MISMASPLGVKGTVLIKGKTDSSWSLPICSLSTSFSYCLAPGSFSSCHAGLAIPREQGAFVSGPLHLLILHPEMFSPHSCPIGVLYHFVYSASKSQPSIPSFPCFIFLIVLITWHILIFTCLSSSTSTPLEYSFLWAEIFACFAHIPFPAPEEWQSICSKYQYNIQRPILKEIGMNPSSSLFASTSYAL